MSDQEQTSLQTLPTPTLVVLPDPIFPPVIAVGMVAFMSEVRDPERTVFNG
jgi:hypothetical protein